MAWTFTLNFQNDALNAESRDAFATAYNWQGASDPRGDTKAKFRDYIIRNFIREVVHAERIKADNAQQSTRVARPDVSELKAS